MKKRIYGYRKRIDELLAAEDKATNWDSVMNEHLQQIAFFQHERLVHLIVTMTFALLTILSLILVAVTCCVQMLILTTAFLVLFIPYIKHYYILENEVQKMYGQYDEILKKLKADYAKQ